MPTGYNPLQSVSDVFLFKKGKIMFSSLLSRKAPEVAVRYRNLNMLASLLSQKMNVKVEYGAYPTAFWDFTTQKIHIPSRWAVSQSKDTEELLTGIIVHEGAGHGVHTDGEMFVKACKKNGSGNFQSMLNILEDIYIENRIIAIQPHLGSYLIANVRILKEKEDSFRFEHFPGALNRIIMGLLIVGRCYGVPGQKKILQEEAEKADEILHKEFGRVWEQARTLTLAAAEAKSTKDTVSLTERIWELIMDYDNPEQYQPPFPKSQSESQTRNSRQNSRQNSGSGSGNSSTDTDQQNENGQGRDENQSQNQSNSNQSGDNAGEDDQDQDENPHQGQTDKGDTEIENQKEADSGRDDKSSETDGQNQADTGSEDQDDSQDQADGENGKGGGSDEEESQNQTAAGSEGQEDSQDQADADSQDQGQDEGTGEGEQEELAPLNEDQIRNIEDLQNELQNETTTVSTELTDLLNEAVNQRLVGSGSGSSNVPITLIPRGNEPLSDEALGVSRYLMNATRMLKVFFEAEKRSVTRIRDKGLRVSAKHLYRVGLNDSHVFKTVERKKQISTSALILVDKSGSMYSSRLSEKMKDAEAVNGMMLGFGNMLEEIGVDFGIYTYCDDLACQKAFDDVWHPGRQNVTTPHGGMTSSGGALNHTMIELLQRPSDRKIVIFLTDGDAGDPELLESSIGEAFLHGIHVVNIFIGNGGSQIQRLSEKFGMSSLTCDKLEELNGYLIEQFKKALE